MRESKNRRELEEENKRSNCLLLCCLVNFDKAVFVLQPVCVRVCVYVFFFHANALPSSSTPVHSIFVALY